MSKELTIILGEEGAKLAEASAKIAKDFIPHWESLQTNCQTGQAIIDTFAQVEDTEDKEALAEQAHQCWKAINGSVNSISKAHEVIKKPINEAGKVVDTFKRLPTNHAKGIKDGLKAITKYKEDAERERKYKLRSDRQDQVTAIGGAWALYEDLGEVDAERFDTILEAEIEKATARKIIQENADRLAKIEADALKVKQDAERLEEAKELAKAELAKAEAKAVQDAKDLAEAKEKQAKADAQKLIDDEALRVAKAQTAKLEAEKKASDLAKKQKEALLQGDDKGKFQALNEKLRELSDMVEGMEMQSEFGKNAVTWALPKVSELVSAFVKASNKI